MENRLKNLEDPTPPGWTVCGALVQGCTIRADNYKKLDEIRGTVEEKLQTRCSSGSTTSSRQSAPSWSRSIRVWARCRTSPPMPQPKQVLSGVKTRGILGEVQLGAILEQILAPGQYEESGHEPYS